VYDDRVRAAVALVRGGCSFDSTTGDPIDDTTCTTASWDHTNVYMVQNPNTPEFTFDTPSADDIYGKCVRDTSRTNKCDDPDSQNKIDVVCDFDMKYFADPTDTGSKYDGEDWYVLVATGDDDPGALFHSYTTTSGNWGKTISTPVLSASAFNVLTAGSDGSIDYGALTVGGAASSQDSTVMTNTGNTGLDQQNRAGNQDGGGGSNPEYMCRGTEYPTTCATTPNDDERLPPSYQRYSKDTDFTFTNGSQLTSSLATVADFHVVKPIVSTPAPTGTIFWKAQIPSTPTKKAISYKGLNTIGSIISNSTTW
jgi:hypothetical protein